MKFLFNLYSYDINLARYSKYEIKMLASISDSVLFTAQRYITCDSSEKYIKHNIRSWSVVHVGITVMTKISF